MQGLGWSAAMQQACSVLTACREGALYHLHATAPRLVAETHMYRALLPGLNPPTVLLLEQQAQGPTGRLKAHLTHLQQGTRMLRYWKMWLTRQTGSP
jgi:hypothetical protein